MTDAQATARKMLKKNQQYLSTQQMKTLNGLIKSGDITGAMNGLHTLVARKLTARKNENYILPIIGELKEILNDHRNDLDKCPALKESLEQFMFENDELSECTWIEIMWENEIKVRSIRVKFIFNYKNRMYCLLQHYYSNVLVGMERMNHVVRYISKHKDDAQ